MSKVRKISFLDTTRRLEADDDSSYVEPDLSQATVMSEEEEEEEFGGIGEDTALLLRSALKAASEGIAKGIASDLASNREATSIFHDIAEWITAPITLSAPGRELEREVKNEGSLVDSNAKVNTRALTALDNKIIKPSLELYGSNFSAFQKVIQKAPIFKDLEPNNISNIEAMAIELRSKDMSITGFSSESPYKVVLKQVIPMLREKFDAIASFDETLGPGSKIDYEGIANEFNEGMEEAEDVAELERFYKAIEEWRAVLVAFQGNSDPTSSIKPNKDEGSGGDSDRSSNTDRKDIESVLDDIHIHAVRPGQNVERDPTGSGGFFISDYALNSGETPVVKLYIKGDASDEVNSAGSGEEYLEHFVRKGKVVFPEGVDYSRLVYNVTRESVSGGSEVTIYFDPNAVRSVKGVSANRVEIMSVPLRRGTTSIFADDASQLEALRKISSTETSPLYETVSPTGETVYFSPSDLVISGGKLKDSKGKSFVPKKRKGKSLSSIVMSKGYGKVKK